MTVAYVDVHDVIQQVWDGDRMTEMQNVPGRRWDRHSWETVREGVRAGIAAKLSELVEEVRPHALGQFGEPSAALLNVYVTALRTLGQLYQSAVPPVVEGEDGLKISAVRVEKMIADARAQAAVEAVEAERERVRMLQADAYGSARDEVLAELERVAAVRRVQ